MSLSNSKDGVAIFVIGGIAPGVSGSGEVTIANDGDKPGSMTLTSRDLTDSPGTYGGDLSERLELRLDDITSGAVVPEYVGRLGAMPTLRMGTLPAGGSNTYRFTVSMLDGGPPTSPYVDDNAYQSASASIGYEWTLTEQEEGATPTEPSAQPAQQGNEGPGQPARRPRALRKMVGTPDADNLIGTSRAEEIYGLGASDLLRGRKGDDYLLGGSGSDRVYGENGADRLRGGTGPDRIYGGAGPDVIFARDGEPDRIDCGSGSDIAYVDEFDRARHCESVRRLYGRLFPASQG
jgi:Ca2+-binding RTX toxin-like protein